MDVAEIRVLVLGRCGLWPGLEGGVGRGRRRDEVGGGEERVEGVVVRNGVVVVAAVDGVVVVLVGNTHFTPTEWHLSALRT